MGKRIQSVGDKIAEIIAGVRNLGGIGFPDTMRALTADDATTLIAGELADYLKENDPLFDRPQFLVDCNINKPMRAWDNRHVSQNN